MMTVRICVGSACHLKGARDIVGRMKRAVEDHGLSGEIGLEGSFCMGECSADGVCVMAGEHLIRGVTAENFDENFKKYILTPLERM